jgi:hypothetical protein
MFSLIESKAEIAQCKRKPERTIGAAPTEPELRNIGFHSTCADKETSPSQG